VIRQFILLFLIIFITNVYSKDIEQLVYFEKPEEAVRAFETLTINLLKMSNAEPKSQRFIYALSRIENLFDFKTIGALILGKHAENKNEDLEFEFIEELRNLTARTMVTNYINYSGQKYKTIKITRTEKRAFIFTEFYISDNETIPFRFVLKNNEGNWKIINIIASGVSELSVKKIEYQSFLETKTLSDLIQEIKRKNQI
tara:strand:- start:140 stop:739 length:600 start_codon:yes stop_codon:yes gene_type:complete